MTVTAMLVHIPENGNAPYVVCLIADDGSMDLWFAYGSLEIAEAKLPELLSMWTGSSNAIH